MHSKKNKHKKSNSAFTAVVHLKVIFRPSTRTKQNVSNLCKFTTVPSTGLCRSIYTLIRVAFVRRDKLGMFTRSTCSVTPIHDRELLLIKKVIKLKFRLVNMFPKL